jgi:hypothetical protein
MWVPRFLTDLLYMDSNNPKESTSSAYAIWLAVFVTLLLTGSNTAPSSKLEAENGLAELRQDSL